MTDWRTETTVRASAYSQRAKTAWDSTTAGIRVLAGGLQADINAGDLYLGHLQSLMAKWSRILAELRTAIDSGNSIMALQSVEVLGQLATNTEGLAATVQARVDRMRAQAAVSMETTPETEPPPIAPGEEEAGIPGWIVAFPFGLVLLWLFGR